MILGAPSSSTHIYIQTCIVLKANENFLDVLPILLTAIESPTPTLVDVALRSLPVVLPILDFSTIKNELFPVIAAVFSKTNSLAIKVRGCRAFVILCGGSNESSSANDGLDGLGPDKKKKTSSSSALDKYTMQEKIIPLIKAIKTKEPAVMMAALDVLRVVGENADADFVAMDILPILWNMSLGPLLDLKQFQSFMELIKSLSRKVEEEQLKKLQELSVVNGGIRAASPSDDFIGFGGVAGTTFDATNGATEDDFERLVKGKTTKSSTDASWDATPATAPAASPPSVRSPQFSWSTPSPTATAPPPPGPGPVQFGATRSQASFRTVTPDLAHFGALTPSSTQYSQPLQPTISSSVNNGPQSSSAASWNTPAPVAANPWASTSSATQQPTPTSSSFGNMSTGMANLNLNQSRPAISQSSSFSLPPPPTSASSAPSFSLPPPPGGIQRQQSSTTPTLSSFGQPSSGGLGSSMAHQQAGGMSSMMNTGMGMGMARMNSGMSGTNNNSMNNMMGGMSQPPTLQPQPQPQKSGLDKYESLI